MSDPLPPAARYALAILYFYGAAVHVANIVGLGGFVWAEAPLRWQILDVIYLVLDLTVVAGLLFRIRIGIAAFVIAALSQIILYTMFRDWVLDVPTAFAPSQEEQTYLSQLVAFHIVSLALVMFAVLRSWRLLSVLVILPMVVACLRPAKANTPVIDGVWASPGLAIVVRFEPCPDDASASCGRFVWSWDGDESLEHAFGSLVLRDVRYYDEYWRGSLIDPDTGRAYRGTLQRVDEHTLHLRGCAGPFCRSQTWRSLDSVTATLLGILAER